MWIPGTFSSAEDAAVARDDAARERYNDGAGQGKQPLMNFPREGERGVFKPYITISKSGAGYRAQIRCNVGTSYPHFHILGGRKSSIF